MTETASRLRMLIVEDSEDDALLLLRELRKGGIDPYSELVDSEERLCRALHENKWDILITDHNMPGFSSFRVLELAREHSADLPVIIVSGTIGEKKGKEKRKKENRRTGEKRYEVIIV